MLRLLRLLRLIRGRLLLLLLMLYLERLLPIILILSRWQWRLIIVLSLIVLVDGFAGFASDTEQGAILDRISDDRHGRGVYFR